MKKILFLVFFVPHFLCGQPAEDSVMTPTGVYKAVSEFKAGDRVMRGRTTGSNVVIKVEKQDTAWFRAQGDSSFESYTIFDENNKRHSFFKNQSIFRKEGTNVLNVVHAFTIQVGDTIYDDTRTMIRVTAIAPQPLRTYWYRFEIDGDHSFIMNGIIVHNASRFWVGGGSGTNWNSSGPTNWGSVSGGSNNATLPTSSDDVTFDGAGSGNGASTVSANISCLSLTFTTGYTNTITLNATLTCAGNFIDRTSHNWGGSGTFGISGTSTITSNGKTMPNPVNFTVNSSVKTLNGNWTISGLLTLTGAAMVVNLTTTETLICAGGLTVNASTGSTGTAKFVLTGGTWTCAASSILIQDLDLQGNVTLSGNVYFGAAAVNRTLTYVSGTITTTGATLNLQGSCTLNTNGMTWNAITVNVNNNTTTINSPLSVGTLTTSGINWTCTGTDAWTCTNFVTTINQASTVTLESGFTYTITGSFTCNSARLGNNYVFASDSPTDRTNLVLSRGATCNVSASFTRVDASGGRQINSFTTSGTIVNSINIKSFLDLQTVSSLF